MRTLPVALAIFLLLSVSAFGGTVLWDHPTDASGPSQYSQVFTDIPEFASYLVMDVTVPTGGWTIQSITMDFLTTVYNEDFGPLLPVQLVIIPASGSSLPDNSYDPSTASVYNASFFLSEDSVAAVTVDGLNISLAAGDYWIGMSPMVDYESAEFRLMSSASTSAEAAAWRNPAGGFGVSTDWIAASEIGFSEEGNIHIEGVAGSAATPEPSTMGTAAFALIAGAGLLRRARKRRFTALSGE